jgi:hypothetical protein
MNTKPSLVAAVSAVLVLLFAGSATAQTAANKKAVLNKTRDLISKLPPQQQGLLTETSDCCRGASATTSFSRSP